MANGSHEFATPPRRPRVAAIGLISWDRLIAVNQLPSPGGFAVVSAEFEGPGGTTSNSAVALARLGAEVYVRAVVGNDGPGKSMREIMDRAGIDIRGVTIDPVRATDAATIIVSTSPPERTIYWHQGAHLVRGDRIDITYLFDHDLVLLDVDDLSLRRFLLDLPAHTLPRTHLLGTLTYLNDPAISDAFDLLLRHDTIVGNARELMAITSANDLEHAISRVRARMPGQNLRAAAISLGSEGSLAFTGAELWRASALPVTVIDTTGAGDAFAGGVAFGIACRWTWPEILRFANGVAGLSTTALGAQTALPGWDTVITLLRPCDALE